MRMYWATIGGSKRLVFVLSLSVLPTKTCNTQTRGNEERDADVLEATVYDDVGTPSNLVPPLAVHFVSSICVSIKAARHLEGLDVLSRAHATGTLRDDARQTHLLLHIDLLLTSQPLSQICSSHGSAS